MSISRYLRAALPLTLLAACRESVGPSAEELALAAPVPGTPMRDVFYGAYVDHDPGGGARDYACGHKAYDGHAGVDILLRNFTVQDSGVPVVAAADGVVATVVDGLPDRNTSWDQAAGLGNHVVVTHGGGISTAYGHLRRGSVRVERGRRVERGAVLGEVGSSGRSNWPHLHFEVRGGGVVVEPFTGDCAAGKSLWAQQPAYQDSFMVTDAGLTDGPATLAALLERPATLGTVPLDAEGFRFWLQVANQPEAEVRFELRTPGGERADETQRHVGRSFSMRYLVLNVPVAGALATPGRWEIRTYQDGELVWTEPFTLQASPAADAASAARPRSASGIPPLTVDVLDPVPGSAGPHP